MGFEPGRDRPVASPSQRSNPLGHRVSTDPTYPNAEQKIEREGERSRGSNGGRTEGKRCSLVFECNALYHSHTTQNYHHSRPSQSWASGSWHGPVTASHIPHNSVDRQPWNAWQSAIPHQVKENTGSPLQVIYPLSNMLFISCVVPNGLIQVLCNAIW